MKRLIAAALALLVGLGVAHAQPSSAPAENFRNLLIGGDFGVNPYQLGTTAVTGITTTGTFHADRWFAYTSASSAYLTQITTALPTSFGAAEQLARTAANANTSAICMAQIVENASVIQLQGQTMVLSYYVKKAANFSGTGVQAKITVGTGASQSMASLIAGTWTGQADIPNIALETTTTSWVRKSAIAPIPLTSTELAVQLCFSGVGTAGAVDGLIFTGIQLEGAQSGNPLATIQPTSFEQRSAGVELALAQRYLYVLNDPAATVRLGGTSCSVTTANTTVACGINLPVPMRTVPTTTIPTAASFGIVATAGTAGTCTTLAATASSNTTITAGVTCTTGATIALGSATPLIGAGTAGKVIVSAEY